MKDRRDTRAADSIIAESAATIEELGLLIDEIEQEMQIESERKHDAIARMIGECCE